MSLLNDAADFEDRRWRDRLTGWRRDAAVLYLRRVAQVFGGLVLLFLLVDGCRRDSAHGTATIRTFQTGAALQSARGTLSPCFVGQGFAVGDTLLTDNQSAVSASFPDGCVIKLGPSSQVVLVQSDAFRNGRRFRSFTVTLGSLICLAPPSVETSVNLPGQPAQVKRGSFRFEQGVLTDTTEASALAQLASSPTTLVGVERFLWQPVDFLLDYVGVSALGTLAGTDRQRREECRRVGLALQRYFRRYPPTAGAVALDSLSLEAEDLQRARTSVRGNTVVVRQGGAAYSATITARDSEATVYQIDPKNVVEDKIK